MKKCLFCLLLMLLFINSSISAHKPFLNPENDWTAPVKTVLSVGNTVRQNGTRIDPRDFGIVLLAKNQTGGWFLFEAPQDGDYVFSVRAPNLSRASFQMRFYFDENDQVASAVFNRSNEVQEFVLKGVKKGQTVYWWDDDYTGRAYTLLDSHELMITIANEPEVMTASSAASQTEEESLHESFPAGDTVIFGHYEQDNDLSNGPEPIEWQVLDAKDGRMLLISKYGLDQVPYNKVNVDITWEDCTLRAWLNDNFFNSAFSFEEQSKIAPIVNKNPGDSSFQLVPPLLVGKAHDGNDTVDRVFLLSIDEVYKYFSSDDERRCSATAYAIANEVWAGSENEAAWWLRTMVGWAKEGGSAPAYMVAEVQRNGNASYFFAHLEQNAVRPVLWFDPSGSEGSPAEMINPEELEKGLGTTDRGVLVDSCVMRSYLNPGDQAEVAINMGLKIRKEPAGEETGVQAFPGKGVKILGGPVCQNGVVWFEIDFLGHRGWSMEGKDGIYYLKKTSGAAAPASSAQTQSAPAPTSVPSSSSKQSDTGIGNNGNPAYPILRPGDTVEIINIASLQMFGSPNRNPMDGVVAFPGKTAKITDGPQNVNNVYWYEIDFLGYRGWVMGMTVSGIYYLEKVD